MSFDNYRERSKAIVKPLKPGALVDNLVVNGIDAKSAKFESIDIVGGLEDLQLFNVEIFDSLIENTIIGSGNPGPGFFTTIQTGNPSGTGYNVCFYGITVGEYACWNASSGTWQVSGDLTVSQTAELGNIGFNANTISSTNTNGDINIYPNGFGTVRIEGPISHHASIGNVLIDLDDGFVNVNSRGGVTLNSENGSGTFSVNDGLNLTTLNGDICLQTEIATTQNVTLIDNTGGLLRVTTSADHNLNVGDIITLGGTNSNPVVNGNYTIGNILTDTTFVILGNVTSNATIGNLFKKLDNNIKLDAAVSVKIPENVTLTFGETCNSISGNTGAMTVKTCGDLILDVPSSNSVKIVNADTKLEFTESGTTYLSYSSSDAELDFVTNKLHVTATTAKMDITNMLYTDPILTLGGLSPKISDDNKDRGIEFFYHTGTEARLGWFGYKDTTGRFTFIPNATNTNEVITGEIGNFEFNTLFVNNISLLTSNGVIDANCGRLLNTSSISGCKGNLSINGSANVTINASNSLVVNTNIFRLPNNSQLAFGTCGSSIVENTSSNLVISGCKNIQVKTTQNGTVSIPPNSLLTFTGSTSGVASISGDTSGNMSILSNRNINLSTTNGNVIIPSNTKLQLGGINEYINSNTVGGMFLNSSKLVNIDAINDIKLTSTTGNIVLNVLDKTNTVNIPTSVGLVFSLSGTDNSINSDTSGDLWINGKTSGNIVLDNVSSIKLYSDDYIKIKEDTELTFNDNLESYIKGTSGLFYIVNESSVGNTIITSKTTNLNNTGGSLNVTNINTYTESSNWIGTIGNTKFTGVNNFTISGPTSGSEILLCTKDVRFCDPIITLGYDNLTLTNNDGKDRGLEYEYYDETSGTEKLGWFGWKNTSGRFTFYSDAVNNDEVISGTIGELELSNVFINGSIEFLSTGVIDLNCGDLVNVSDIFGCIGDITIHASNNVTLSAGSIDLIVDANGSVDITPDTPLNFGSTSNSISGSTDGILMFNAGNKVVINASLQVLGTTTSIESTIGSLVDPIFTLGGTEPLSIDDNKDRGLAFHYHTGTEARLGFFGFLDNSYKWTYIPNATNVNEVITGDRGDIDISGVCADNLTFNPGGGEIKGVVEISGGEIDIITTSGNLNLSPTSGSGVLLPFDTYLAFGDTTNTISTDTSGNTKWYTNSLSICTFESITLDGSGGVRIPENTYLYFGDFPDVSTYIIKDTSNNFEIFNSEGNILLTPSKTINSSTGHVVIPANNPITFCDYNNRIESDCDQLYLYGYNGVSINTGVTTIMGDLNVIGSISASSQNIDINEYILPLGTSQVISITSLVNGPNTGDVDVTTNVIHNLSVGDTVEFSNTDSVPVVDGTYTVDTVVDVDTIRVVATVLNTPGTSGGLKSLLVTDPGKDVGIQVNWHTGVTTGTSEAETGFFGFKRDTLKWTFFERGLNTNDVFTGTLGNIELYKAHVTRMSGFILDGTLNAGSQTVFGSNFNIDGGTIDNTAIGSTIASTGRFTTLTSTIHANLEDLTLAGNLNYSCEEFTVSSVLPIRNPLTNTVVSFINVSGVSFTSTGNTMADGTVNCQVKKLVVGSMGTGCEYHLNFTAGKLIAPDACSPGSDATLIKFKRKGQGVELLWYDTLSAWVLSGGSGAYVT
jgi:hypothetical protein